MKLGKLAVRGVVGPLFIGHGTQKLFGWFGGHGLEGTAGFFEQALGLRPGKRHAAAAGVSEALGGLLITLGALTPMGAAMISGAMVTAIRKVHGDKGPWVSEGGYEYNALILATMFALSESGPGRPSVDARTFPRMRGTGWALLQLGAGVAGSYLTTERLNEPAPAEGQAPATDQSAGEDDTRFGRETAAAPSATPAP
ncbi:MAG: putative oxidoreductase [Solirubrobacteraceae bacterium]|jgi:putative oxidoreductase|nr:putative oxidoreductase [Solirubrobacteraceae bacterium]